GHGDSRQAAFATAGNEGQVLGVNRPVDDAVVKAVHDAVVVEVAVAITGRREVGVNGAVDLSVVQTIDEAVQILIAAIGVHDQGFSSADRLAAPHAGIGGSRSDPEHVGGCTHGNAGEIGVAGRIGFGGDDAAATPSA